MISRQHFVLRNNRNKERLNLIKGCSTLSFTNEMVPLGHPIELKVLPRAIAFQRKKSSHFHNFP